MNLSKVFTSILVLSLSLSLPLGMLAQPVGQKEPKSDALRTAPSSGRGDQTAQHELALQTLNVIIPEIDKLQDFRERVRLKARAAGLLWEQDESRARIEFRQILASIEQHQPEGKSAQQISWLQDQLRQEVIQEALRYDRQFAEELAKSKAEKTKETDRADTDKSTADLKTSLRERTDRANRLAALAQQTMSEDPERALKLAEESLAEGVVSPQLFNLIIPLRMSLGAARTNALFERVLGLLLPNPYLTTFQLQGLAIYIFPDLQLGTLPSESVATPVVASRFIQQFFDLALMVLTRTARQLENLPPSASAEQRQQLSMHAYFLTRQLQPKAERHGTPEAVVGINSLADQLGKHLSQEQRQMVEANATPQASVANLLNLAGQEREPDRRDAYYAQAAMSAYGSGDYHNALNIAERIENRDLRQQVQQQIKQLLVQILADRGEFDVAARYARELEQPAQRAWGLFWVARALAKKKDDQPRALPLLVEAEQTAVKLDESVEKAQTLLWITDIYVQIESLRSFEVLSQAVKSVNAAFDDKGNPRFLMTSVYGQNKSGTPSRVRATDVFKMEPLFQKLAREDFIRIIGIAQSLSRPELRLAAQLAACQAILEATQGHRQPESKTKSDHIQVAQTLVCVVGPAQTEAQIHG